MKEMFFVLSLLMIFGFFLASCKKNDNNPITTNPVGNIYIISDPVSAQIWLDGTDTKKITPDSLTDLKVGNHLVILKATYYLDDTTYIIVQDGSHITLNRKLLSDNSISLYGPIQIWDTTGALSFPNGIILKTGRSSLTTSGGKDSIDFYYSSNGQVITIPSGDINNRITSFFVGLSTNLNDSVESPTVLDSWLTQVQNSEINYFYIFDSDSHYSKMIITDRDPGSAGNPAWIKVKWFYNNRPNDRRF
jgi:PEGA domain